MRSHREGSVIRFFIMSAIATIAIILKLASISPISVGAEQSEPKEIEEIIPIKGGDLIGTFRVSRGMIPGIHEGIDLAVPEGTPLFVFGEKGEEIFVECHKIQNIYGNYDGWGIYGTFYVPSINKSFLVAHLSKCNPGSYHAGEVWGFSGDTGKSTGPHTHTEQYSGEKAGVAAPFEEPDRSFIEKIHGL